MDKKNRQPNSETSMFVVYFIHYVTESYLTKINVLHDFYEFVPSTLVIVTLAPMLGKSWFNFVLAAELINRATFLILSQQTE